MPARVANIAPCITQVTFKLVHYALLINQMWFGLTFLKVLANFLTDNFPETCNGCWSATLELTKILMVELIR